MSSTTESLAPGTSAHNRTPSPGSGTAGVQTDRPARGRRSPTWSILGAAVAVAVAAAAAIVLLQRSADQHHQAEILVTRIEELSQELVALERLAERDQVVSAEVAEQVDDVHQEMSQRLTDLVELDPHGLASQRVEPAFRQYEVNVTELFRLLATGDLDAAHEWDEEQSDPSHDALLDATAAASAAYREQGRLASLEATIGSTLTIALATLAMGLLFWSFERQRRSAAVLATERRALRRSEQRFRSLVQNASDVVAILDAEGSIGYLSPAAERTWGHPPEALRGTRLLDLVHEEDRAAAQAHLTEALRQPGLNIATELQLQHADGAWRDFEVVLTNRLDEPAVGGIVATYRDVTERKAFERQLRQLAFQDRLTGLANRALFLDRLERGLARAERRFRRVAVLYLDLDNFKLVNDSLGHQQGDALLAEVGRRLQTCLRAEDTAARLGGDEFTLLLEELTDESAAAEVAGRIAEVLRAPFVLDGREVFISASIGIALSAPRGERPESVLRNADLAMYRAKADGKARHAVFDRSMASRAIERLELETDLRRALEQGEFRVHYQPILSLADGRIAEVEALVRWEHPQRGLISPVQFIPVAEETGLIVPLGHWVLEAACRQARLWQDQRPDQPPLVMSVNLSARQFQHPHLVADIQRVVQTVGLEPRTLKLEITESVVMQDAEQAAATLKALKALGIQLAIDDFGTGYSSLSYLKRFPVDTLKIDRSFVDGVGEDTQDAAIVRSVVALAKTLKLSVTGEGIETPAQQAHLRELGCDRGQGYLFARPLPAPEVERLLASASEARPAA